MKIGVTVAVLVQRLVRLVCGAVRMVPHLDELAALGALHLAVLPLDRVVAVAAPGVRGGSSPGGTSCCCEA